MTRTRGSGTDRRGVDAHTGRVIQARGRTKTKDGRRKLPMNLQRCTHWQNDVSSHRNTHTDMPIIFRLPSLAEEQKLHLNMHESPNGVSNKNVLCWNRAFRLVKQKWKPNKKGTPNQEAQRFVEVRLPHQREPASLLEKLPKVSPAPRLTQIPKGYRHHQSKTRSGWENCSSRKHSPLMNHSSQSPLGMRDRAKLVNA